MKKKIINKGNFKDGRSLKKYYCLKCGKKISWQCAIYGSGLCRSCATKKQIKEKSNPMKDKRHTETSKENMRKSKKGEKHPNYTDGRTLKKYYCKDCGREISVTSGVYGEKSCKSCARKGKKNWNYIDGRTKKKYYCIDCGEEISYCSLRCHSCASKGILNSNYIEGLQRDYPLEWTETLKEKIRQRDNYTCQKCGMTEEEHLTIYKKILEIHHIDYDKENCNEENLITLCLACNTRANYNRNYWNKYYKGKILDYYEKKNSC